MAVHHDKHHQAYVTNLNKALENYPDLQNKATLQLLNNEGFLGRCGRLRPDYFSDG
jgi:superoxide dismutase